MMFWKKSLWDGFLHHGTLYFALAQIWHLPYGEEIVGTITAIDTFLGVVLEISTIQYNKKQEELQEVRDLNGQV